MATSWARTAPRATSRFVTLLAAVSNTSATMAISSSSVLVSSIDTEDCWLETYPPGSSKTRWGRAFNLAMSGFFTNLPTASVTNTS